MHASIAFAYINIHNSACGQYARSAFAFYHFMSICEHCSLSPKHITFFVEECILFGFCQLGNSNRVRPPFYAYVDRHFMRVHTLTITQQYTKWQMRKQ